MTAPPQPDSSPVPLPVGLLVAQADPAPAPPRRPQPGRFVTLTPLDSQDAGALYAASHGSPQIEQLWTYMSAGPFADAGAMAAWLEGCRRSDDPLFFTVNDLTSGQPVGLVSYMNIVPAHRRLELGNIWYTPAAQRTKINTESIYLMLGRSFDELGYRRVEWKCDALNARSRAAALRLGFQFEGIFRQHMLVRGRNRDTAWFAMTDGDWPRVKANLEAWLYGGGSFSLTERHQS